MGASLVCFGQTSAVDCGKTYYNETSDNITMQDPGKGNNCTYYIVTGNYTPQVAITFSPVSINSSLYNLTVYAGNITEDKNSKIIANLTEVLREQSSRLVVSGYRVTSIVLSRASVDSSKIEPLEVLYNTAECSAPPQEVSGIFLPPLYMANNGTITCTYTGNITLGSVGVLSFSKINISSGSIDVQFGSETKTTINGSRIPADTFGAPGSTDVTLTVNIENSKDTQSFEAIFQSVNQGCSGKLTANSTFQKLSIPTSNPLPLVCYTRIEAETNNQVYLVDIGNYTQTPIVDSIVYYDGNNTKARVLGTLQDGLSWRVSSGSYMTVVANLGSQVSRVTNIQYKDDGSSKYVTLNNKSESIVLNGSTVDGNPVSMVFEGLNMSLPYVKFEVKFEDNNSTATNAAVEVRSTQAMSPFTFTNDTALFPVVMPGSKALVVVTGLGGQQNVSLNVTPVATTDCNQLFVNDSGRISLSIKQTDQSCTILVVLAEKSDVILYLNQVDDLCQGRTLDIYLGLNKTSHDVASLPSGTRYRNLAPIRFPAGSTPRLEWKNKNYSCAAPTVVGRYLTEDIAETCLLFGPALSGTFATPYYPNQYPLNVYCNWTIPAMKNSSLLYLIVNTTDFRDGQNITIQNLQNNTLAFVNGTELPPDLIIPNKNLSAIFTSGTPGQMLDPTKSGRGAQITYKVVSCGELVTNTTGNLMVPDAKNKSLECIWIIQVPAGADHSVNNINATITATGYKDESNGTLQIFDGNSMRLPAVPLNWAELKSGSHVVSRSSALIVRYAYTNSSSGPFSLKFSYKLFTCNSKDACDNSTCIHKDWRCDNKSDCRDGKDEENCPPQPAPPEPQKGKSGVAGYWIAVCLIIGIVLGVILTVGVPKCIGKIRRRKFAGASNYGSLSEDT